MTEMMPKVPNILTIAGSDSGGGAGIQADLKTFSALNVYGLSVITALTAQNTKGVSAVETASAEIVSKQLTAVFDDIDIAAVKIGMLADAKLIEVVAEKLAKYQPKWVVLDPVMIATSGDYLLEKSAIKTLTNSLFPLATLITPNLHEAQALLLEKELINQKGKDQSIDIEQSMSKQSTLKQSVSKEAMLETAKELSDSYDCAVLLKGGHANEESNESNDLLYVEGEFHWFSGQRVNTKNTHGTGCTLSSAIASYLALGHSLTSAVKEAKHYIQLAIEKSDELQVGRGNGPVQHNVF